MIKGETTKTEPMENMDMRNEQNVTQNDTNQGNVKPSVSLSGISAESQIPSSDTEKTTVENTPKN
ncbi:MAG: hypothetical protein QXT63_03690, partial [Thermoplasmata archaeon]